MKKVLILLLSVLLIPMNVFAETCDPEGVTIQSIEMIEKADGSFELTEATANGTVLNLDIAFTRKDDYIKYKTTVKNNTDVDYVLDESMFNKKYTNVRYTFETEDKMVKAGSTRDLTLLVSLTDDPGMSKFNETNSFNLDLTGGKIINPETGVKSLIYILPILTIIAFLVVYFSKKKEAFKAMVILLALITIPTIVKAVCKCNLKINSTVTVENCKYKFVTDEGSFEDGSDVKEICVGASELVESSKFNCSGLGIRKVEKSGELFESIPATDASGILGNDISPTFTRTAPANTTNEYPYAFLQLYNKWYDEVFFNEDSYIKVYSDSSKQNLVKTITKADIPEHYYILEYKLFAYYQIILQLNFRVMLID